MMKLVLDFGNTLQKAAIFDGDEMVFLQEYKLLTLIELKALINKYTINKAILSSVINHNVDIVTFLKSSFPFVELDEKTKVPLINKYHTINTLGKDRLAAIVAAQNMYPDENVLVINAGTCITYDFINDKKDYLGGAISPGVQMKFKALNNFTDKLPFVKGRKDIDLIGKTTEDSILSGVINGTYFEMKAMIEEYKTKYKNLKIILSGGDRIYFDKRFNNTIFAISNIVLIGLNLILDFNVK